MSAACCLEASATRLPLANWLREVLLGPTRYRVTPRGGGDAGSKQRRTYRAAKTGTFESYVMGLRKTTMCIHSVTETGTPHSQVDGLNRLTAFAHRHTSQPDSVTEENPGMYTVTRELKDLRVN
jgi:hypothetical protein